jgi:membrane peptidoglycan carboxypeptidase
MSFAIVVTCVVAVVVVSWRAVGVQSQQARTILDLYRPMTDRMLAACDKTLDAKYAENGQIQDAPRGSRPYVPSEPSPDVIADRPVTDDPYA